MAEEQNGHGLSRLDRIEQAIELLISDHVQFCEEHKSLLTSQVVLTDRVDKLTQNVEKLTESQKHTDDRLNALIALVDDQIRRRLQ